MLNPSGPALSARPRVVSAPGLAKIAEHWCLRQLQISQWAWKKQNHTLSESYSSFDLISRFVFSKALDINCSVNYCMLDLFLIFSKHSSLLQTIEIQNMNSASNTLIMDRLGVFKICRHHIFPQPWSLLLCRPSNWCHLSARLGKEGQYCSWQPVIPYHQHHRINYFYFVSNRKIWENIFLC